MEHILIDGHIGPSYVDEKGELQKGVELVDIISAVKAAGDVPILQFDVKSPGGYVDFGNQIYEYILSLKKEGKTIEMYQVGLIGSIATKIFMAGDVREVDPSHEFFIHNPWMVPESGDADKLRELADSLEVTEKELRKFYASHTKISDEGLDALMKNETSLTADQAVGLGFATRVKSYAFALINKKMAEKKEDKTLKSRFMALLDEVFTEKHKAVKPKAQVPGAETAKSMLVNLAEGAGSFWVDGEELVVGASAVMVDEAGAATSEAVPDGDYKLEDGSMVTVMEGKISAITPAESALEEDEDEMDQKIEAAVKKALAEQAEAQAQALAKVEEGYKSEILALKKNIKLGVMPPKPALKAPEGKTLKYKSIGEVMAEKKEERKKQLNGIK